MPASAPVSKVKPSKLNEAKTPSADHRALGNSLDLFSTNSYSPGSHLFHPDGTHVFQKILSFMRAQYITYGFREVITPTIYKQSLWELSGHWQNYKDDMYEVTGRGVLNACTDTTTEAGEDEKYGLKPMNCPGHCLLYKDRNRSYRDLPIRYADFSPLHRNEVSGSLSGLTRVRRFHQDDGHIFCTPSQVREEIQKTLTFVKMVYDTFGLGPYKLVLSTRPQEKFIGDVRDWDQAEAQLKEALDRSGHQWTLNLGDGAFYGPKIDIILTDRDGYEHQTATIQLDFQLPQRFELKYQAEGGDCAQPVMIHRAILGSLERFMALLIEHYQGRWPMWLSPKQAIIISVNQDDKLLSYANSIITRINGLYDQSHDPNAPLPRRNLEEVPFTVHTDFTDRSVSKKVAEAKKKHYNLICVVGPRDMEREIIDVNISGQPNMNATLETLEAVITDTQVARGQDQHFLLNSTELHRFLRRLCGEYL
ncbi:MAG: hypothetical protein MMC33_008830 [Icmadophila ericetorum]|nr:hypothetical protein [Icmadophila ericetorum]